MLGGRTVDRVGVGEIVGGIDLVQTQVLTGQRIELDAQGVHQLSGRGTGNAFVIVARIIIAAEVRPMFVDQLRDRLAGGGQQVKPEQHRPHAILFADVVRAGAVALLAAQRGLASVEQVAEELPAGRRLVAGDAEFLGDVVGRARGRHRTGDAFQAGAITRRHGRVRGQDGQAVGWRDGQLAADDHIAVAVAVGGGAHVGRIVGVHYVHQLGGVGRIRIGMVSTEILQRHAVDDGARLGAEQAFQDRFRVRTGDGVHAVEAHREAAREQALDGVDVDIGRVADAVFGYRLGLVEDFFGDLFRRRAAVGDVVLDAEVAIRYARIVAGRQDDAAERLVFADHAADGRRRQNAGMADHHFAEAVGGRHLQDQLYRHAIVEAAIAAQHQRLAGAVLQRIENALDEIFEIVGLAEDGDFFAQARSAGLLVVERLGADFLYGHDHSALVVDARRRNGACATVTFTLNGKNTARSWR